MGGLPITQSSVGMQRGIPFFTDIYDIDESRKFVLEVGKFKRPVRTSETYEARVEKFDRRALEHAIKSFEDFLKELEHSLVINNVKEDYINKVKDIKRADSVFVRAIGKEINFYTITNNKTYNRKMEWKIFEIENLIERIYKDFIFDFVIVPRLGRQDNDLVPARFEKIFTRHG